MACFYLILRLHHRYPPPCGLQSDNVSFVNCGSIPDTCASILVNTYLLFFWIQCIKPAPDIFSSILIHSKLSMVSLLFQFIETEDVWAKLDLDIHLEGTFMKSPRQETAVLWARTLCFRKFQIFWSKRSVIFSSHIKGENRGSAVVKVLRYKSEGRWFDSRCVIGIFH